MQWTAAITGVWLMIASFILGNHVIAVVLWNDIIVSFIIFIFGAWATLTSSRVAIMFVDFT